jgi:hypothetical protein
MGRHTLGIHSALLDDPGRPEVRPEVTQASKRMAESVRLTMAASRASEWEILGAYADLDPDGTWAAAFEAILRLAAICAKNDDDKPVVDAYDEIAHGNPALANQAFSLCVQKAFPRAAGPEHLTLHNVEWLTSLPSHIHVRRDLWLQGCVNLRRLPSKLTVDGSLTIMGCRSLTGIPSALWVGKTLNMSDCPGITALPDDLRVSAGLFLEDCVNLVRLPERLHVGDVFNLRGCTAWDGRIPKGVTVGQGVLTDSHVSITPLAGWRRIHPDGEGR